MVAQNCCILFLNVCVVQYQQKFDFLHKQYNNIHFEQRIRVKSLEQSHCIVQVVSRTFAAC
jgi:hypothetical protein